MEIKSRTTSGALAALGGLAVGALLLSNKLKVSTGDVPGLAVHRTVDVQVPVGKTLITAAALAAGALLASKLMQRVRVPGATSSVRETIDLDVPVSTAYNQWTQFEEFPRFMASVEEVRQLDDTHLHWRANVAGKVKEWDAEITQQIPDQCIAWRSTDGVRNAGVVTFDKIGENRTRVRLQMDYDPQTPGEKIGDAVGGVKLTAKGNLKRFKELIERRGVETGAWRGTVAQH
ncbi:MAG: SRPBCC family protein [Stagnimonas sp.]|nr:SRPBCC family protein [Stagnimonas sp.]